MYYHPKKRPPQPGDWREILNRAMCPIIATVFALAAVTLIAMWSISDDVSEARIDRVCFQRGAQ